MKNINISPTWEWVAAFYFRICRDKKQIKATTGFRNELHRLGPEVRKLLKQHDAKPSLKLEKQIIDMAKTFDRGEK